MPSFFWSSSAPTYMYLFWNANTISTAYTHTKTNIHYVNTDMIMSIGACQGLNKEETSTLLHVWGIPFASGYICTPCIVYTLVLGLHCLLQKHSSVGELKKCLVGFILCSTVSRSTHLLDRPSFFVNAVV